MKRILFLCFLILFSASPVFAADHFIRQGASGSANGSDWTNAWTDLPATFIRGDTYYVADGTYGAHTFDTAASGTTYIYIKKATALAHGTETGWSSTYGDGVAEFTSAGTVWTVGTAYWDFDGVVGTYNGADGAYTAHGIKLTLSGTTGGTYGINVVNDVDYIYFKHLEVTQPNYTSVATADSCTGIRGTSTGADYKFIQYCYIHDWATNCIQFVNSDNVTVEYSWLEGSHSTADSHGQAIYLGFTTAYDWTIRYNVFKNINGSAVIFMSGDCDRILIYGNLFWEEFESTDRGNFSVDGIVGNNNSGGDPNSCVFYNNTMIDYDGRAASGDIGLDAGASGNTAYNNLWYACNIGGWGGWTHDYNASDDDLLEANDQTIASTIFTNYAGGVFTLASATNAGTTLSSPYNTDMLGNTRGSDGVWDRGAYEYETPPAARSASGGAMSGGEMR